MEILAALDDVNANLDNEVVTATDENTSLLQISVARVVRGYLSRVIDTATLVSWADPETTPTIIREIAGKLIASQLYFNLNSRTAIEMSDEHVAQRLYNAAIKLLDDIIAGLITVDSVLIISTESMSDLDYFPIDATDRAFSMGMKFYGQDG